MRPGSALALSCLLLAGPALAGEAEPLPKVAEGWAIELVERAPKILYPTAVVVAPDGTTYLGQDPMDMPGPPTSPIDSVLALGKDGKATVFADKLWSVMGLEWADGTLYVVHAPFLSAFRDTDGDGRADQRVDLVTGLGPKLPGFNGINDHVASGIRLGMDGFLYISVGDKGVPKAVARDGSTATMATGGVIRVRPDGSNLEVVSTGERNPLSVALTATDEVFTYGNDDDSKKWPNSLTHHVVGGHHGYPYEFLAAPYRALPIVAGHFGGAGGQGVCYNEDGLPPRYRGDLFFCDWGLQAVHRYKLDPEGGTYKLRRRETIVERGELADFRPFSIATGADGGSFLVVDWAFNGWLSPTAQSGRLYRLTYRGKDAATPRPRLKGGDLAARVAGLDHPALGARLDSQRFLADQAAVTPLIERLKRAGPAVGRRHALWALDAIGTPEARTAIRATLDDADPSIRLQGARSAGIRRDRKALPALIPLLRDPEAATRREAAIALGRLGDVKAAPALYEALGDLDEFAAWSVRRVIREIPAWDAALLAKALEDPERRESALKLADESWSVVATRALADHLEAATDAGWRARVVAALAGLYHRYPAWSGQWFGTNPLAASPPRKTEDWSAEGMDAALRGMARGLRDDDASVRRQAILGLYQAGPRTTGLLRVALDREADPVNLAALAEALGLFGDAKAVPALAKILQDPRADLDVRLAVLDVLTGFNARAATNARMMLLYQADTPDTLVARALPALGLARLLPINDLVGFLDHKSEAVRASALRALPTGKPLPGPVREAIMARLDDPSIPVRKAAIAAIAAHQVREATPKLLESPLRDPATHPDAIQALAAMPDPRAIPAYIAAIEDRDPSTRKAGEAALLAIRDAAAPELESAARQGRFRGSSALAVERILTRFRPVTSWKAIGPFPRTTTTSFFANPSAIDLKKAETGAAGRSVAWQGRAGDPKDGRVVLDDLKGGAAEGFGFDPGHSPDLAAFAFAELDSPSDRPALMLVGSSGAVAVMVNDQVVLNVADIPGRAFKSDSDLVRLTLRKGGNRILVMARQGAGSWSFGLQVSDPSNLPMLVAPSPAGVKDLTSYALGHPGTASKGEALFFDEKGANCARCHAAAGRGTSKVGPDLTGLASKYDRAEVIRSVLEPSSRLATGYQPTLIARRDGTVVAGVVRSEADDALELVDAQGTSSRIPKAEIESREPGKVSTMPSGLADSLTPDEFADLVAYLMSLKASR